MGGEKESIPDKEYREIGSPPRGRGKESYRINMNNFSGITPAWAGKSLMAVIAARGSRDHPRVGGKKAAFAISSAVI